MPLSLRAYCDAIGVPRAVGLRLAGKIGGVKEEGGLGRWVLPDDAVERTTADLVGDARDEVRSRAAASVPAAAPSAPGRASGIGAGLADERAAVEREQLAAARARAKADTLRAEKELERLEGGHAGGADTMATMLLLQRIDGLERKLEGAAGQHSGLAPLLTALAPILAPLVEQFAARPGLAELLTAAKGHDPLAVARELKELGVVAGGQDGLASARQLLELTSLLRPLLGRRDEGGAGGFWAETARLLAPELPTMVSKVGDIVKDVAAYRLRISQAPARPETPRPGPPAVIVALQAELAEAAQRFDQGYFPKLAGHIRTLFPAGGPQLLEALAAGTMPPEPALAQLAASGVAITPPIARFLHSFVAWLKYHARPAPAAAAMNGSAAPPVAPPPTNGGVPAPVYGRCDKCGAIYEGEAASMAEPCDQCNGRVVAVVGAAV